MAKGDQRSRKREKFLQKQNKRKSSLVRYGLPVFVVVLVIGGGAFLFFRQTGKEVGGQKVASDVSYEGKTIRMTNISVATENGKIIVPLEEVKRNKLIYFEYQGSQSKPLLAYLSSAGRIVTAISVCEPCKSTRFHIKGDTLVCNACGTIWRLSDLRGISGGCIDYPPDVLESTTIQGNEILIDEAEVSNWKPRV